MLAPKNPRSGKTKKGKMPGGEEEPSAALPSHTSTVRSSLSGSIAHEVVQARDVHGGLHFHAPADVSPRPVPRQLPAGVHGFVDRAAESRALDRMVARRPGDGSSGARILVITGTAGGRQDLPGAALGPRRP